MRNVVIIICLAALLFQGCRSSPEPAKAQQEQSNSAANQSGETKNAKEAAANVQDGNGVLIDSKLSLAEALGEQVIPEHIKKDLSLVDVRYYAFDGKLHQGQIVIHSSLREDVVNIFREIEKDRFPIAKVIPVSRYAFSDDKSMEDNNTSAFNYRTIDGTDKLSNHALGRAIDINPFINPFIKKGKTKPSGAKYDPKVPGTITKDSPLARLFKKQGWQWGGDWKSSKDYQHFEK